MPKTKPLKDETLNAASEMLKAVSHPLRLRILELLEDGQERNVSEIQAHLGVKQSIASGQLVLLRDRGIVGARRDGVQVFYSVINPAVLQVLDCIRRHRDCFEKPRYA